MSSTPSGFQITLSRSGRRSRAHFRNTGKPSSIGRPQSIPQPSSRTTLEAGQGKTSSTGSLITQAFATAVQQYEKAAETYRTFFDPEAMEEFADDPNTFKNHLAKEVPVIAGTLNQRRSELQKWQRDFRMARGKGTYWRSSPTSSTSARTG